MEIVPSDWGDRHKKFNSMVRKSEFFAEAVALGLDLHQDLHVSKVSGLVARNKIDALWDGITQADFAVMPSANDETMAWAVWHISRIEDLTMNILVNQAGQVFDESWRDRLMVSITDTGNGMTKDEIVLFSQQLCVAALLEYRDAVGCRSREIIRNLNPADMKRKVSPDGTARILREGGVTENPDSIWLLDFWGRKDVAGILLMPLTRHPVTHLNACDQWKRWIQKRRIS